MWFFHLPFFEMSRLFRVKDLEHLWNDIPAAYYCWADRSMMWEFCPILSYMANGDDGTPDILIKSMPYPLKLITSPPPRATIQPFSTLPFSWKEVDKSLAELVPYFKHCYSRANQLLGEQNCVTMQDWRELIHRVVHHSLMRQSNLTLLRKIKSPTLHCYITYHLVFICTAWFQHRYVTGIDETAAYMHALRQRQR